MGVDERARHDLFVSLEQILGPDEAATLTENLPPAGWADVATKRDLDLLAGTVRKDMEVLESKILATIRGEVNGQLQAQTRALMLAMMASVVCVAGLVFAAARLG